MHTNTPQIITRHSSKYIEHWRYTKLTREYLTAIRESPTYLGEDTEGYYSDR